LGYFEDKLGLPSGQYSPEFLEIDAEAGPWLTASQQSSPVAIDRFPSWSLDLDEGVIWFGDEHRNGVVASVQLLGTYAADSQTWLWAWANPKQRSELGLAASKVRDDHPDVPELTQPSFTCPEPKAWAVAAAAAFKAKGETCFRLPGEVSLFVALFDVTELDEGDPRSERRTRDPEAAQEALAGYAGPAAIQIGALLLEAIKEAEPQLDPVITAIHQMADNLEDLSRSPVGKGTPAAQDAFQMAQVLRHGTLVLASPTREALVEGIREVLNLLGEIAKIYGAWTDESTEDR
jgi:hypothetical protein